MRNFTFKVPVLLVEWWRGVHPSDGYIEMYSDQSPHEWCPVTDDNIRTGTTPLSHTRGQSERSCVLCSHSSICSTCLQMFWAHNLSFTVCWSQIIKDYKTASLIQVQEAWPHPLLITNREFNFLVACHSSQLRNILSSEIFSCLVKLLVRDDPLCFLQHD